LHPHASLLLYLGQGGLGLGQPEGHVHVAVQLNGGGQLRTGLLSPASLEREQAEAAVAMGHERTHTELRGQREGLVVARFGVWALWGLALRSDLAKQPEGPCLIAPFVALASSLEGMLGEWYSVIRSACQQVSLT